MTPAAKRPVKLVLLGDPVAHSLSPVIQQAALDATGIAGTYTARRVDDPQMHDAVDELRTGALDGANVTMPHKRIAAEAADRLIADASRAGVANTLFRRDRQVVGANTDVAGVKRAWQWAGLPYDLPILVLGAGGAAAAALLAHDGRRVCISARRSQAARRLLDRLEVSGDVIPWASPVENAVLVNATPLGMHGELLPRPVLDEASGLFEMAYGNGRTPAAEALTARGSPVSDGTEMLLAQAMASFELWTMTVAPEQAMRTALERHVDRHLTT